MRGVDNIIHSSIINGYEILLLLFGKEKQILYISFGSCHRTEGKSCGEKTVIFCLLYHIFDYLSVYFFISYYAFFAYLLAACFKLGFYQTYQAAIFSEKF